MNTFQKFLFWDGKIKDQTLVSLVVIIVTSLMLGAAVLMSIHFSEVKLASQQSVNSQTAAIVTK